MKQKILEACQTFSRCALQPIMFMAVTGTVIALSVILSIDFMPEFSKQIGAFIKVMMDSFMNNLSVIFCIGITAALAKKKKVDAAILGIIIFLMFIYSNNAWLSINNMLAEPGVSGLFGTGQAIVLGVQITDMGVFLGIILGCLGGYIHNKFSSIDFKPMFNAYGGARLAYIVSIPTIAGFAILMSYVWPVINNGLNAMSDIMSSSGAFGVFLYNFGNRFFIPTGLHHLFWMPFTYTSVGGTAEIAGSMYSGATNIWLAQMANSSNITELHESSRFLLFGLSKIFGTIGITLAFIKTAKPENKIRLKGLILPAAFVALMAGITEPFEFSFLFISPLLWIVHSVIDGISGVAAYIMGLQISGKSGIIDLITNNIVMPMSLTKIYLLIPLGIACIAAWYFAFKHLIIKFNIKTPGREEIDNIPAQNVGVLKENDFKRIKNFIEGLGGAQNIEVVNNCFTRLRIDVKDISLVDEDIINKSQNSGIVKKGKNVQIIIGLTVQKVREDMCEYLGIE